MGAIEFFNQQNKTCARPAKAYFLFLVAGEVFFKPGPRAKRIKEKREPGLPLLPHPTAQALASVF
ncbi:hypothetical protein [Pseudogulbenkiania sp. MAI-1]|uniref:hypothetical protein n=1 Tax=Pseudogulbenkiania sp. MAI-1 TaxID=990370 RepID=UPI0012EC31B1|nr:hypothetical protein [Pseudogulbenkiania sp. MAI-1]